MIELDNMSPENIRTQFDTSEMNTSMNAVEELNKCSYYTDDPYIPEQDPRAINVVENIENRKACPCIEDDVVTIATLNRIVDTVVVPMVFPPMSPEEFKEALLSGGNVVLSGDAVLTEQLVLDAGSDTSLDLNGRTLTLNYADNYALNVKGNLVIAGNGTVDVSGYGISTGFGSSASVIINDGTFNARECDYLVACFGGDITINGGTFNGEYCVVNNFAKYYGKDGKVIINGGTFNTSKSEGSNLYCLDKEDNLFKEGIIVNGGKFSTDPSDFLAEGKSVVFEDGMYVVK